MTSKTPIEINAAEHQKELIIAALQRAKMGDGLLLNLGSKKGTLLYPSKKNTYPFNALIMALDSDEKGYNTNLYTLFSSAKKNGDSVLAGQKGIPVVSYSWNEYQSKTTTEKILKEDYRSLSKDEKKQYTPIRTREIRTLFNIDQTTLPLEKTETYEKLFSKYGFLSERDFGRAEDKSLRKNFNKFLQQINDNLIPIKKDGTEKVYYDKEKEIIHLSSQMHYDNYAEYVQEALRQIAYAAENGKNQTKENTRLAVELLSAVKMTDMGLPSKLSPESLELVDKWKEQLEKSPSMIYALEAQMNHIDGIIQKAQRGEKIERNLEPQLNNTISAKVTMIKDDSNRWAMFIKPEQEPGFAMYLDKEDLARCFNVSKDADKHDVDMLRQQLAQKYYLKAISNPELKEDPFKALSHDVDTSRILRVNIVRTKGDDSKILCYPKIEGIENVEPREVSQSEWQLLWLALDKDEYKKNLAAKLYYDILKTDEKVEEHQSGLHR